jgi:cyclic dehypoxanthinyl futalosine synthase
MMAFHPVDTPGFQRIERGEALRLFEGAELLELGGYADRIRRMLHPEGMVSFVVDRNVNYTNICASKCAFCAFYRDRKASDAYVLSREAIFAKIDELVQLGGTQLLMQGGLNPDLKIGFFEQLFREIKARFPSVQNHSLSPAEVVCIAENSGLELDETLERLKQAGLDSIPGGGAEILVDEVRGSISPNKIGWRQWAEVMSRAARLGMPTTATMMFGSREKPEDIVEHLFRVREIQDRGGSFTAFIPWTYQPGNTELGGDTATGV